MVFAIVRTQDESGNIQEWTIDPDEFPLFNAMLDSACSAVELFLPDAPLSLRYHKAMEAVWENARVYLVREGQRRNNDIVYESNVLTTELDVSRMQVDMPYEAMEIL